jgi:ABC-type nickel/cobalt efflux system permease component RcnA
MKQKLTLAKYAIVITAAAWFLWSTISANRESSRRADAEQWFFSHREKPKTGKTWEVRPK